jgi:hypothetical protein
VLRSICHYQAIYGAKLIQKRDPARQDKGRRSELSASNDQKGGTGMSIIGWIFLGLIAGFIASKIVNKEGSGFILDIALSI